MRRTDAQRFVGPGRESGERLGSHGRQAQLTATFSESPTSDCRYCRTRLLLLAVTLQVVRGQLGLRGQEEHRSYAVFTCLGSDVWGDQVTLEDRGGATLQAVRDGGEDSRREEARELLDGIVDAFRESVRR